jgi:hypothetical protein
MSCSCVLVCLLSYVLSFVIWVGLFAGKKSRRSSARRRIFHWFVSMFCMYEVELSFGWRISCLLSCFDIENDLLVCPSFICFGFTNAASLAVAHLASKYPLLAYELLETVSCVLVL